MVEKSRSVYAPMALFSSVLGSVPWCCILPASLSLVSVTGVMIGQFWVNTISWAFLPVSVGFLARAFWIIYARHQGAPWARRVTWASSVLVLGLWTYRIWIWFVS